MRASLPPATPLAGPARPWSRDLKSMRNHLCQVGTRRKRGATALIILALVDPLPRRRRDGPGLLPRALLAAGPLCQQLGQRGGAVHGQDQRLGRAEEAEQAVQAGKDEEDEVVRVLGW